MDYNIFVQTSKGTFSSYYLGIMVSKLLVPRIIKLQNRLHLIYQIFDHILFHKEIKIHSEIMLDDIKS